MEDVLAQLLALGTFPLALIALALALWPVAARRAHSPEPSHAALWTILAHELGWQARRGGRVLVPPTDGGPPVRVLLGYGTAGHESMTTAEVAGLPESLWVRSQIAGGPCQPTGCESFDAVLRVSGAPGDATRLGPELRETAQELIELGREVRIEGGRLLLLAPGVLDTQSGLETLVAQALALARGVGLQPLEELLEVRVLCDPDPGVRARAWDQLRVAAPARLDALADELAGQDHAAARYLAAAHHEDVAGLVASTADTGLPHLLRTEALRRVLECGNPDEVCLAVAVLTTRAEPSLVEAALEAVLERPAPGASAGLRAVASDAIGGRDAAADRLSTALMGTVARLVGVDPGAESLLRDLLEHRRGSVRHDAAMLLGEVGTVTSVPALREAERHVGALDAHGVQLACRNAVAAIQARAKGSRGGLALAQSHGGEVSVTSPSDGT